MTWKALSFSQPWLDFILRAARGERDPKLIENRTWSTTLRGPFLLHAAKSFDRGADVWMDSRGLFGNRRPDDELEAGGFVAVARLVDVLVPEARDRDKRGNVHVLEGAAKGYDLRWWMRDKFGLVLADVRAVPWYTYPGSLSLWRVPEPVVKALGLPASPDLWVA